MENNDDSHIASLTSRLNQLETFIASKYPTELVAPNYKDFLSGFELDEILINEESHRDLPSIHAFAKYEIRYTWDHHWWTDVFNTSTTHLSGDAWIVDASSGIIPTWNLIETWCWNGCDVDLRQNKYYKHSAHTTSCPFGWGNRDGKHGDVWVYVTFTNPGTKLSWWIKSCSCPGTNCP